MRALIAGFLAFFLCIGYDLAAGKEPVVVAETSSTVPTPTTLTTSTTSTTTTSTTTSTTTTTTTTVPPTTTTTTTTLPPWKPADECRNISRPVSRNAMRWCGAVAEYLYRTGEWQPGDLTKLMRTMDCESGGNPLAKNPRSTASGLFQFLDGSWRVWGPRAARYFGFDNPQVFKGYDNIAAAVLYYTRADESFANRVAKRGPAPWPNCGKR